MLNDTGYAFFGLLFVVSPIIVFVGVVAWRANRAYSPSKPPVSEAPAPAADEALATAASKADLSGEVAQPEHAPTIAVTETDTEGRLESDAPPLDAYQTRLSTATHVADGEPRSGDSEPHWAPDLAPFSARRVSGVELVSVVQKSRDHGMNRAPRMIVEADETVLDFSYTNGGRADRIVVHPDDKFDLLPDRAYAFYNEPWRPPYFRCRILWDTWDNQLGFLDVPASEFEALAPAIEPDPELGPDRFVYPSAWRDHPYTDVTYSLEWEDGQESFLGDDLSAHVAALVRSKARGVLVRGPNDYRWTPTSGGIRSVMKCEPNSYGRRRS